MNKVEEFIAEDYPDSITQQRRFVEFCESNGYEWEIEGNHAMCAWSLNMYKTSTIEGRTMEQYVSAINAYETSGLGPPGKPAMEPGCM
jgi:hypothetical protein